MTATEASANSAAAHHAAKRTPFGSGRNRAIQPRTTGRALFLPEKLIQSGASAR
jgi:hypothetical protein